MPSNAYVPADSGITVDALALLSTAAGGTLRARVAELADAAQPTVAEVTRLRQEFPAAAVRAALSMGGIQKKAHRKFPEMTYVWAPPEALEQATSARVARCKASTMSGALGGSADPVIFDLCCGIGGDAMAFADIAPVHALDLSEVRIACLALNVKERAPARFAVHPRVADVQEVVAGIPTHAGVHIDPARRSAGRRSPRYEDLIPGPLLLDVLACRAGCTAIKLSPAVDFDTLPSGYLEFYSENGAVVQAVLWTGDHFRSMANTRSAIMLDDHPPTFTAFNAAPATAQVGDLPFARDGQLPAPIYLYELDGTLTRARLAAPFLKKHSLVALTPDGGYAVAPTPAVIQGGVTGFEVRAVYLFSEGRIAQALSEMATSEGARAVEVKSRGRLPGIDNDHLQIAWARAVRGRWTVLIFPHSGEVYAAIARRVPTSPPSRPHLPSE